MKKILLVFLLLVFAFGVSFAQKSVDTFFKEADILFSKYVANGRVGYKSLKSNITALNVLYAQVNKMKLEGLKAPTKKAFYLNAYNIVVIHQVMKYYPLKSPLDKKGFFDQFKHIVAGESMTLNSLEKNKVIAPYKDARIHFALACAAIGCPKLANFAYQPTTLEKQLNDRTKLAINDDSFIRVKGKKVLLSQIFKWYTKDFTTGGSTLLAFVNKYRNNKLPSSSQLGYYEYDWRLNQK